MATVPLPSFTDGVDLRYFIEPLGGPAHPKNFLDRFPDALYNKSPDSHFMRFMYTLMGPTGVGAVKKDILLARLLLEQSGARQTDLEAFYGDPFSFGRILDEYTEQDITGLLPYSVWATIQAQDEAYRARAIKFLNAVRLGTSPGGMQLAAASGLGSNVAIYETYKYLFDIHSDIPLGLPYRGQTNYLGEFAVVPRPDVSQAQAQTLRFDLVNTTNATSYTLSYNGVTRDANGNTVTLSPTADSNAVLSALTSLRSPAGTVVIGSADVTVTGGPLPGAITVLFAGALGNSDTLTLAVTFLDAVNNLVVTIPVETTIGVDTPVRVTSFGSSDIHAMQVALDYLRPVASFPTFRPGQSLLASLPWNSATASTEYTKVIRYVTGTPAIAWPATDNTHWIVARQENEAPLLSDDATQHYVNFHNIASIVSYTDAALADPQYATSNAILSRYMSVHVGSFPEEGRVIPFFTQFAHSSLLFDASRALASSPDYLTVTDSTSSGTALLNGSYPADYLNLPGVPTPATDATHFWASVDRTSGADVLEIDLGSAQAVNYLRFEILRKPIDIAISYEARDQPPARRFVKVTAVTAAPNPAHVYFEPTQHPWETIEWTFNDGSDLIFTRFLRLTFTRRGDSVVYGRYLFDPVNQVQIPWTINVRNLRIGRNVPPSVL